MCLLVGLLQHRTSSTTPAPPARPSPPPLRRCCQRPALSRASAVLNDSEISRVRRPNHEDTAVHTTKRACPVAALLIMTLHCRRQQGRSCPQLDQTSVAHGPPTGSPPHPELATEGQRRGALVPTPRAVQRLLRVYLPSGALVLQTAAGDFAAWLPQSPAWFITVCLWGSQTTPHSPHPHRPPPVPPPSRHLPPWPPGKRRNLLILPSALCHPIRSAGSTELRDRWRSKHTTGDCTQTQRSLAMVGPI